MTDLEEGWAEVHAANENLGWLVGRAYLHDEMCSNPWEQYAYDPSDQPKDGKRSREWTAVGRTEDERVREMARCLREIRDGRVLQ